MWKAAILLACLTVCRVPALQMYGSWSPGSVLAGANIDLYCNYQLDDVNYTLEWAKDGIPFYTYNSTIGRANTSDLDGIQVTVSSTHVVHLSTVSPKASGAYQCTVKEGLRYQCKQGLDRNGYYRTICKSVPINEESAEPLHLEVVVPPSSGPVISGVLDTYRRDDVVDVKCTSGVSAPKAVLTWYVNDRLITKRHTSYSYTKNILDIYNATSSLRYKVTEHDFQNGRMKITCKSSMRGQYSYSENTTKYTSEHLNDGSKRPGSSVVITTHQSEARIGDQLTLNCTSGPNLTPRTMLWYLNKRNLRTGEGSVTTIQTKADDMHFSQSYLIMKLSPEDTQHDLVHFQCLAIDYNKGYYDYGKISIRHVPESTTSTTA